MCHVGGSNRHLTALKQTSADMETVYSQLSCAFLKWCWLLQVLLIAILLTFWKVVYCVVNFLASTTS